MIISNIVTAITAVNEIFTFSKTVLSLWPHWNRTENQEGDDVPELQSSVGSHSSRTEKQELKEDDVLSSFQCLRDTLPAMYNFTDQAEWRRCEKYVAQFHPELKASMYVMEELLKDFRYYKQKVKLEGSATSAEPGTKFFHDFIQGSFSKLIHIQRSLHNQYRLLERMSLHQATPRFDRSVRPETTSFLAEGLIFGRDEEITQLGLIFGRDEEITKLIRMLGVPEKRSAIRLSASNQVCGALDNNEAAITSLPVLPVVGIGGVGKTTLAQIIYYHPEVQNHFDVKVWICVSDDFDVKKLTKEALTVFSGKIPTEDNLSSLQAVLANIINKRRFLFILDDIWTENGELWKTFYAPFKDVLEGSMMLVTTRSPKVADVVGTVDPFLLEGLKDHILYNKHCIFGSDRSNNDPMLEQICKQILPKLKGSPLAAKAYGRLLALSLDPAHWNKIVNSLSWEIWQDELDILREPQHFASTSAGTQAATSFHIDVPPVWPHPMSRRQRGQIDSDSSILKVLKMVLCMNKDMSNALHREKQARKRDSKRIKRGLKQFKKLRREAGKEVSPSGSEAEAEELEVESEGEQYPDLDAIISQVEQQYGQSYAQQGGGYGYDFGGQFHPGPSLSSALQQHQQFGPRDYFNAANTGSGYGYGRRLSFTDSEASYGSEPDSPPPEGKGKAVVVDVGRRRRRTSNPSGFMAAARRSHPQVDGHPQVDRPQHVGAGRRPQVHPARVSGGGTH